MGNFQLAIHYSPLSQVPAIDDDEFVRHWNREPSCDDDEGDL